MLYARIDAQLHFNKMLLLFSFYLPDDGKHETNKHSTALH